MWKEGGGVYNRQCAAGKLLVESKCVGDDAVWSACAGAPDPRQKSGNDYTRNAYTQGKGELVWDTWPNSLVLRVAQTVSAA